jgi:hypothetical protein
MAHQRRTILVVDVLKIIDRKHLTELSIGAFPEDMSEWSDHDQQSPQVNQVYGFDRKSDYGWENIVFFVKKPSEELKQKFDELKNKGGNSLISKPYSQNPSLWIFGWF